MSTNRRSRNGLLLALGLVVVSPAGHGLTIDFVQGDGFGTRPAATLALQRAAAQWTSVLADPITVTIETSFLDLGSPNVIGNAASRTLTTTNDGFDLVRNRLVLDASDEPDDAVVASLPTLAQFSALLPAGYSFNGEISGTKANFKAIGFTGLDNQFGATDAFINFNTLFNFDYDSGNGVTAGAMDFETVAAHEIGHALGFVSIVDVVDAVGAQPVSPRILDLFRFPAGAVPQDALEFTTAARELRPAAVWQ